ARADRDVGLLVAADPLDRATLDRRRFDVTLFRLLDEVGVGNRVLGAGPGVELLDHGKDNEADDEPDEQVLEQVIQLSSFQARWRQLPRNSNRWGPLSPPTDGGPCPLPIAPAPMGKNPCRPGKPPGCDRARPWACAHRPWRTAPARPP